MKNRIRQILTWAWLLLVFGGGIFYLATNFDSISEQLRTLSPLRLVAAVGCLIAGKLMLVQLSRHSVEVAGMPFSFWRMFTINSLSQLAKYLPGGIWHFVGRASYYHQDGMTLKQATGAMIVENIWLVSSALFVGATYFVLYAVDLTRALGLVVLVVLWVLILVIMTRWRVPDVRVQDVLVAMLLQIAIWTLLGMALWVLIPTDDPLGIFPLAVGAFGLSWAIGYLTLFAPSGLGVREAVLVTILAVSIAPAQSVVFAAINRLTWVITELILGFVVRIRDSRAGEVAAVS